MNKANYVPQLSRFSKFDGYAIQRAKCNELGKLSDEKLETITNPES
jgi:hypothetical protein